MIENIYIVKERLEKALDLNGVTDPWCRAKAIDVMTILVARGMSQTTASIKAARLFSGNPKSVTFDPDKI